MATHGASCTSPHLQLSALSGPSGRRSSDAEDEHSIWLSATMVDSTGVGKRPNVSHHPNIGDIKSPTNTFFK